MVVNVVSYTEIVDNNYSNAANSVIASLYVVKLGFSKCLPPIHYDL